VKDGGFEHVVLSDNHHTPRNFSWRLQQQTLLHALRPCALLGAQAKRQAGSKEKGAEIEKRQQRHTWPIPC